MGNSTLEERIQRLEDIESIKQLKVKYSHICDITKRLMTCWTS